MKTKKPKLTKWFNGRKFVPYHVGEYIASTIRDKNMRRWWNGSHWSVAYYSTEPESSKERFRRLVSQKGHIHFIGLAQKPEVQP